MTAASLLISIAVFTTPYARAQSAPNEGLGTLTPAEQSAILDMFKPTIGEICGNFRAKTEINKNLAALTDKNECGVKLLENTAMFQFILEDTIARCAVHARQMISSGRTRTIKILITAADMARFASDTLAPILKVNCR